MEPDSKSTGSSSCIYCDAHEENSDDHIFPQFMGGSSVIPACRECNSSFGSSFEAGVSSELAPTVVALSLSGVKPKKVVVFRKALQGKHGNWFDLNSEGEGWPSTPAIERANDGHVVRGFFRSQREVDKLLEKAGDRKYQVKEDIQQVSLADLKLNFSFEIADSVRKVATKMCIALARRFAVADFGDVKFGQNFLVGTALDHCPVYYDLRQLEQLDALRPPLAHLIYFETDAAVSRSYGVVQFYGTLQFFCEVGQGAVKTNQAFAGYLDPVSFEESFFTTLPL